jgi:hypothetical protein
MELKENTTKLENMKERLKHAINAMEVYKQSVE